MTDRTPAQLDRFVAEKVMGYTVSPMSPWVWRKPDGTYTCMADYHPTDDPAQALEVLETWAKWPLGRRPRLSWDRGVWHVYLGGDGIRTEFKGRSPTLPLAICRALWQAMGAPEERKEQ